MTPRNEQGTVSTELAVLTPLLIGLMLFAVFGGRVAQAEADVAHAAHEAARAASLQADPAAAVAAAREMAAANIAEGGVACRRLEVTVDTALFAAGGQVAVTVSCQAAFADLAFLAVPGHRTFTATATEVIDTYRADQAAFP